MSDNIEKYILKIPIVRLLIIIPQKIYLPKFKGLTLYDLLKTYFFGIIEGTFSSRAGSIAFSFFMALFPFILFLLNLIPYLPIEPYHFVEFIDDVLPKDTASFFMPVILDIIDNPRGGLLSFVFLLTIFLMSNGINAIFSSFEYSYHITINRSFFKQYFVASLVSIFLALLLLLTIVIIVFSEQFIWDLSKEEFLSNGVFWVETIRSIIFIILVYFVIAILYYFGIKKGKSIRFFSIGALVTTMLFVLTTYLFGVYITNFSNYNELYGSIGALLILMLYIWINSNLLLLGFELNATLKTLRLKE
ncbi:MAG: YihY/virulence factor BrkB family protein [Flavobacteriaceae bacterium]|jgi:membrane protein|nr:YihY/virulence factor BrkB family protein [Flavobacteriaceae bacterium]